MQITPQSLVDAAMTIGELAEAVHDPAAFPALNASRGVTALAGSPIAAALTGADQASSAAKQTIASRHAAIAELLYSSASSYSGKDEEIADQLAAFGDLNGTAR